MKQEEIRDGIAKKIAEYNHLHWEKISESQKVSLRKESDLIIRYLHSKDVVIRVDRELPEIDFDDVSDIKRTGLMNAVSRHTVDILLGAGCGFFESLIGEKSD